MSKGNDTLELLVLVNHLNAMFVMLFTEGGFAHGGKMAVHDERTLSTARDRLNPTNSCFKVGALLLCAAGLNVRKVSLKGVNACFGEVVAE